MGYYIVIGMCIFALIVVGLLAYDMYKRFEGK